MGDERAPSLSTPTPSSPTPGQSAPSSIAALSVGRYVPTPLLAASRVRRDPPARRSSTARLGVLETLDEVSHANALHLRASDHLSDDAAAAAAEAAAAALPPTQRALAAARADGYALVATDLTTVRWHERWDRMCLEAPPPTPTPPPVPDPDGPSLVRSSSRPSLATLAPPGSAAYAAATVREAEQWRAAPAFNRPEVTLSTAEAAPGVLTLLSPWLELDSIEEGVRLDAELALVQEISYAAHVNLAAVVLPPPSSEPERRRFLPHYARAIAACLAAPVVAGSSPPAGNWMSLVVRLPITSPHEAARLQARRRASPHDWGRASPMLPMGKLGAAQVRIEDDWAWDTWATIQEVCNHNPRVKLMLDLGHPLPQQPSVLHRWKAEPVAALWIPATSFLPNPKGYPVLSKACQMLVKALLHKKPHIILADTDAQPPHHPHGGSGAYLQYLKHLARTVAPPSALDVFAQGYADKLQAPLQPLLDNLESNTYAVFEKDATKYQLYEDAVALALADLVAAGRARGGVHIWVCGAGRGPLVSHCLAAAARARTSVHITAVEKNPSAMIVLQERQQREWGVEMVTLRYGDMRVLPPPPDEEKADIVVSELLGSFGDNELSPECLDGAMRFLRPDGISIPSTYCSYLTPLTSPTLYAEATAMKAVPPISDEQKRKAVETPYVVLIRDAVYPAGRGGRGGWAAVQTAWSFHHGPIDMTSPVCDAAGLPLTNAHNVRTSALTFHIPQSAVIHGLAGYFEASLYGDIVLSTHPDPSKGSSKMVSWFPFFLPFDAPLYLPPNAELDVHLWRMSASRRVWYEWYAESFLPLPVQFGGPSMVASSAGPPESYPMGYVSPSLAEGAQPAAGGEPMAGTFQNAPATPSLLAAPHLDGAMNMTPVSAGMTPQSSQGVNHRLSAGSTASAMSAHTSPPAAQALLNGPITRVKTNMTALMNPGGRSSWISL